MLNYFCQIKTGKIILWCCLIWYMVIVCLYFDSSLKLWTNSLRISVIIGTALLLSLALSGKGKQEYWQTFRLYLIPFCVYSLSSLIKGQELFSKDCLTARYVMFFNCQYLF
jgi:hypothetical protein